MNFTQTYKNLTKLYEENQAYYRVEVFDDNGNAQGGLFRGIGKLLKKLWDEDDELYDYINEPLSKLEYMTPYPSGLDNPKIKFAYKHDFLIKIIEDIKDIEANLNEIDWSINITKLSLPPNIVYEDDVQIAYIA